MTEKLRGALIAIVADQIGDDGRQWIEVMPTADKARNGPWLFTITRDDLETYAQSIRDNADSIVVDYDHDGDEGRSTLAAGWFTGDARVEDGAAGPRLLAEVEWTPPARDQIKNRLFRFISPVFSFEEQDAKTKLWTKAKQIVAATLTNRPFFKQLAPVGTDLLDSDVVDELTALHGEEVTSLILAALGGDTDTLRAAVWSTAYINDLPDSAFLHVEARGTKDSDGKTTPRSLRHFPYKDASGKVDLPHLRNAISRIPQSSLSAEQKARLQTKARRILESQGG